MHALILAGGKGTRLRPLTVYTPKPIVPFMNRPFLLFQLDVLRRAGITDVTLSLSYQPDKIEQVLGDGSDFGMNLRFITEPSPMGTGGAYKYAAGDLRDTTIVLNGDILTDIDITAALDFHRANNAVATIALAPVDDPSRYGLVETSPDSRVLRFLEKPKPEELAATNVNTINAGIYILEPEVLDIIPAGVNYSFEYGVFPDLLARELPFFGYILLNSYWRDIGNPESYLGGHEDFLAGRVRGFEPPTPGRADVSHTATVDAASVLDDECVVKPGARIVNSVIGKGVLIEEKAVVENSVIWSHSRIAHSAEVRGAVIGRSCHVGKNAVVGEGVVLGDKTSLTDYTRC